MQQFTKAWRQVLDEFEFKVGEMGLKFWMVGKLDEIWSSGSHLDIVQGGNIPNDDALESFYVNGSVFLSWIMVHCDGCGDANILSDFKGHHCTRCLSC